MNDTPESLTSRRLSAVPDLTPEQLARSRDVLEDLPDLSVSPAEAMLLARSGLAAGVRIAMRPWADTQEWALHAIHRKLGGRRPSISMNREQFNLSFRVASNELPDQGMVQEFAGAVVLAVGLQLPDLLEVAIRPTQSRPSPS